MPAHGCAARPITTRPALHAALGYQEPVSAVIAEVEKCLSERVRAAARVHLFITPPRTRVPPASSLAAAGLVPAATVVAGWEPPLPDALSAPAELLAEHARALLCDLGACDAPTAADFPVAAPPEPAIEGHVVPPSKRRAEVEPSGGSPAHQSGASVGGGATSRVAGAAAGASGKGAPKWFKR